MLVTLLRPTGGHAPRRRLRRRHRSPREVRRRIGVALQEAALDPLMTGSRADRAAGDAARHPAARRCAPAARELIERVGLSEAAERRVGTYSGGMRRRLDLAMALIHEPEVLFLDEPTTGLDPTSRLTLWDEVRRLRDEGTTVFLTTQYLEEADQLADRVGIIAAGKIVAEGTPAALKAEVGRPHLDLVLARRLGPRRARARSSTRFGDQRPTTEGCHLSIALERGAADIAPILRALDDAGLRRSPSSSSSSRRSTTSSCDKTGEHLEGAEDGRAARRILAPEPV